jgi:hypothetical protein
MFCHASGARLPLFCRSQFHAGAALTAHKCSGRFGSGGAGCPNERGHGGSDEQIFGAKQQVPHRGRSDQEAGLAVTLVVAMPRAEPPEQPVIYVDEACIWSDS